jgi:carotenoid cleavage dioxygenase
MVHGVRLGAGRARWYRNRWVRTAKFEADADALEPRIMLDPTASAANTHVIAHAGRILALEEAHLPYELSRELETLGCLDFGGKLTTAFTAHPKLCPQTGELHFFGYGLLEPYLTYHVLDPRGELVHSAEIPVPGATMMHDFMITRQHAIFMDLPVVLDIAKLARGEPPCWDESYGARVGILPRLGGRDDVRWFEIEPCYVFHSLNAFAQGSKVICHVGRHESMWRNSMEDFTPCYLHRWTFDLASGAVKEEALDDVEHAVQRVDERVIGLPHRYGWGTSTRPGARGGFGEPRVVIKYDLHTASSTRHDFGPSSVPDEFLFVEAHARAAEDEGYLLGFVYDMARDSSDLVILDASHLSASPIARIHMPRRVPHGFHGSWIPS